MKAMFFCVDRHGARQALEHILQKGLQVVGCVFDEERPCRLSEQCERSGVACFTTDELYGLLESGTAPEFDVGISYLCHRILKEPLISTPKGGIINFHPAPVTVHKGLAACCYCLLNGYQDWAVTAHYIAAGIDEGDIISERWFSMEGVKTAREAETYVQAQSIQLLEDVVGRLLSGEPLPRHRQDPSQGHYFSKRDLENVKDVSHIHSTEEIDKRIRALWFPPYHGAYITIEGKRYSLVNEELLKELAAFYGEE